MWLRNCHVYSDVTCTVQSNTLQTELYRPVTARCSCILINSFHRWMHQNAKVNKASNSRRRVKIVCDVLTHVVLLIYSWLPRQLNQVSCMLHFLLNAWQTSCVCLLLPFINTDGQSNCCLISSGTRVTNY